MAAKRKDGRERKRRGIKIVTIPVICLLTAVLLVGNIGCMVLSRVLDVYIGTGEANQCITLENAMTDAGFSVNRKLLDMYGNNLANVPVAENSMDKIAEATYYIGEFPQSFYGE